MRSMLRVPLAVCAAWLLAVELLAQVSAEPTVSKAPINPDFLEYRNLLVTGQAPAEEEGRRGRRPSPVDLSHARGQRVSVQNRGASFGPLPAAFDLRTVPDKLPPVRDQGSCNDCWTFATYGSLESWLRPAETLWDFAEMDMNCSHGFDWPACSGGNRDMAAAYLARWDGPVSESCYPHGNVCASPRPSCTPQKRLMEAIFLPDRAGPLDNANIKEAVMTYGAVYTTMFWRDASYRGSPHFTHYYTGGAIGNHSVCIVGWDDDFDRTRFVSPNPPGNGAFIVRNSWGAAWGQDGYCYVSYYDSRIGIENGVFVRAEPVTDYPRIYQHDPYGWISGVGYGGNTAWGANMFTAAATETVRFVGFYTPAVDCSYELYVYVNCAAGAPRSGLLARTAVGTIAHIGYHTVALTPPVDVIAGQRFSVVLRLTSPGYNYPICLEGPVSGYCSAASANPGESFISPNGSYWVDLTSAYPEDNVCLKALVGPDDPDGDGVYGSQDQCPHSVPGAVVDATGCSNGPADLDRDGDVDATDLQLFLLCASGPQIPAPAGCERSRFDADADVDVIDFAYFQRCISGENRPSDHGCVE